MKVAFDIDDTLWKIVGVAPRFRQVPDYDLIQVLRWFAQNGCEVYVWSTGGIDYAREIVEKLGLDGLVRVVQKGGTLKPDITFDDQEVKLGAVNVRVKREGK